MARSVRYNRTSAKFEIRFSGRDGFAKCLTAVKGIPGRGWNPHGKYWDVPRKYALQVYDFADKLDFDLDTSAKEMIAEAQNDPSILKLNGKAKTTLDYIKEAKHGGNIGVIEQGFAIRFKKNPVLWQYAQTIPGVKLKDKDAENKALAPFASAKYVLLMQKRYELGITPEAKAALDKHIQPIDSGIVPDVESPLPDGRTLFQHQKEDAIRMARERYVIVGNEMGTGKTLTTLVAAKPFHERVFIICPAGLKLMWEREAIAVDLRRYLIFSWAKIPDASNEIFEEPFILIADEAHYAQSGTGTTRGKKYLALAGLDTCVASYPLTGTPMKNGKPRNLFPLLKAIRHPLSLNQAQYDRLYSGAAAHAYAGYEMGGKTNLDILHEQIKDCIIQRKKADCLDLPEKMRVMMQIEETPSVEQVYETYLRRYIQKHAEDQAEQGKDVGPLGVLTCERHAVSHAKVDATLEHARDIIDEGRSVVVFTAFIDTAKEIAAKLGKRGARVVRMTGETKMSTRDEYVKQFQDGQLDAFVCTIGAGGTGLTLTHASDVIMHDRPWTPGDAVQAEDRLHRYGQTNHVTAYWMQYGKVDPNVDALLDEKHGDITNTLEGERRNLDFTISEFAERLVKNIDYRKYLKDAA